MCATLHTFRGCLGRFREGGQLLCFPSQGLGACWNILTRGGRFSVLTNAGSNNETLFLVSESGRLNFHNITSVGLNTTPLDTALTANGLFIYTLDGAAEFP